jgi:mannose/cellobiose epimerase-like protein (N-acyl-D-glucosamine 2-epimerase family)
MPPFDYPAMWENEKADQRYLQTLFDSGLPLYEELVAVKRACGLINAFFREHGPQLSEDQRRRLRAEQRVWRKYHRRVEETYLGLRD